MDIVESGLLWRGLASERSELERWDRRMRESLEPLGYSLEWVVLDECWRLTSRGRPVAEYVMVI